MSNLLAGNEVSFAFKTGAVLKQMTFEIARGEAVALLGPNGVGKTTLLKICAGLLVPQQGEIFLAGRPLLQYGRRELARRIALVPQEMHLSFDFTVEDLVSQGRTPYLSFLGGFQPGDRVEVCRAMELAGIDHLASRSFNQLSGGERQRVKIALALAQRPELLLLDEPAQHLDIGRQTEIFLLLRKLNQEGITIVAAVHDLESAWRHFSSAILLSPDAVYSCGDPAKILSPEAIRKAFGVEYRVCGCGESWRTGEDNSDGYAAPGKMY